MARPFVYSSLMAGVLCGCQSAQHQACCDDCTPQKTPACCYLPKSDNLVSKWTAKDCAKNDLKEFQKSCGKLSKDFEKGFEQAYVDLALGRPALTPPVPDSKYWNAYYRSCAGADAVADWFAGYRTGLEIGAQGGVSRFNRVATSWDYGTSCPSGACATESIVPINSQAVQGAAPSPGHGVVNPEFAVGRYGAAMPVSHNTGPATGPAFPDR